MSDTITVYGISNCDTIKKAKSWLDKNNVQYSFHDYRKQGLETEQIEHWVNILGWEALLNKRGTTWRKLANEVKDNVDRASAIKLMLENPAIIKRPLLIRGNEMMLGFSDSQYQTFLAT